MRSLKHLQLCQGRKEDLESLSDERDFKRKFTCLTFNVMNVMNMGTTRGIVLNSRRAIRKERKKWSPCEQRSRICWFLCSLGGTPSPGVRGLEVKAPQIRLWAWDPSLGVLHPSWFGPKPWWRYNMWWIRMIVLGDTIPTHRQSSESEFSLERNEFFKLTR